MCVQPHVPEAAEQEAAGHGTLSAHPVRQGDLGEMEPFRIHGNRPGNAVGDLGEVDAEPAVHDLRPFAGYHRLVQGAGHVDLAVQAAANLVEDAFQDRSQVAEVQPAERGIGLDGTVPGIQETGKVDVPRPVQVVPDPDVETVLDVIPETEDLEPAHRPSGDGGGVAVDARQQADRRLGRGDQPGAAGRLAPDVHLSFHQQRVQQGNVEPFHPDRKRVGLVGGEAAVGQEFLRPVGDPKPVHPEVASMDRHLLAVYIPFAPVVEDAGRKGLRRDGQFAVLPVQAAFHAQVAAAQDVVLPVVEDEVRPETVVVRREPQAVVPDLDVPGPDGPAQDAGVQGAVPVVELQPEVLDVLVLQGQAAGGDVSGHQSVLVHPEFQSGVLFDIHAGNEESQQFLAVVELEIQVVRRFAPGLSGLGQKGGKLFADKERLQVVHQGDGGFFPDEGTVGKGGIEADPVDVVVGVGAGRDVADGMPSGRIFQDEVPQVHLPEDVLVLRPDEVGVGLEGDLGGAPLVQVEGVEVGVAHIGVELIGGVARLGRQVELALEEEVEVRVVADDAAVEGLPRIGARRPDAGIIVAEGLEGVHLQGVDPYPGTALLERGLQAGFQGDGAQGVDAGDAAGVQVPGPRRAADGDGKPAVQDVPEDEVHVGGAGGGIQSALDGKAVQRAFGRGVQVEVRPPGDLREVQLRPGRPFLDEGAEPVRSEAEVLGLEVHPGSLDVGKAGHGTVHASADPAALFLEGKSPDPEIGHRSFHPAGHGSLEGVFVQVRGEVADCLHGQDGGGGEFALQDHPFDEIVIVVDGPEHPEVLQVQVRIGVLDMEVVQQDLPVAHLHLAGNILYVPAGFLPEPDMVGVSGDLPVLHQKVGRGHIGQDVQVVPVDDAVRSGLPAFLSPPDGGRMVHEPEAESFHLHPAGFQEVAEFLLRFSGRLQAQDAEEVAPGLFPGRAGLHHIVEGTVLQAEAAYGNPFLMQESLEGEAGR